MIDQLPAEYSGELLPAIREEFLSLGKTLVVLDDDPTGTQTSYDVTVLTSWQVPLLVEELQKKPSVLFILTNSRSLPEPAAVRLTLEIGQNLKEASQLSSQEVVVISRSDSTLRGHFPAEVTALAQAMELGEAVWILLPAFIEGGRYTINDIHYLKEQGEWVPVANTPFAQDKVFGYTHSNLKEWVEEKTKGQVKAAEVISFSLEDIRLGGPEKIRQKLATCHSGQVCIVNAASNKDLEVFAHGVLLAEKQGQNFVYRSSATFVPIRAGMAPGKVFKPEARTENKHGSLVVVGSYVPKTTAQLEYLLKQKTHYPIEVNVPSLLQAPQASATYATSIINQTNELLAAETDVVIYTSRDLQTGQDAESNLRINSLVSNFLVHIVQSLTVRPRFLVAKGGITSSDLATKGLQAEKALIMGQILPGVPVWKMDEKSKFPHLIYVVFPGNVGDHTALAEAWKKLKGD
ncbi:four-carbon acid sugar kinase family protein [Adhaeribacter aquaticus]|uniref:four-carbon acid sugar kinase family protein n=1 Tax=Adhaeribacter aquaticus TaxID=299567 RepID=UPI0003F91408|nr:four-carbon acid sugar kinase family protein [Adhaeribacter aquaticus]